MRDRRAAVLFVVLIAFVLLVVLFGGRIEDLLLRMHGIHKVAHS
jgi:hypothetical protein